MYFIWPIVSFNGGVCVCVRVCVCGGYLAEGDYLAALSAIFLPPPSLFCLGVQNIACKIITSLKIKGGGEKYSGSHYLALQQQG